MLNILTIDLEDYYQVSAFEGTVKREDWDKHESRIERNTYRLLEILAEAGRAQSAQRSANELAPCASEVLPQASNLQPETSDPSAAGSDSSPCTPDVSSGVKATFFCLGWIGERYPGLIREIENQGHEIACHSYDHQLVYNMTPEEFRQDIRRSKKILEDIVGTEVIGYRAPSYSITHKSLWAFQILAEEGFRYDSSIFPIHHDRYGIPNAPRFPFLVDLNGGSHPRFVPFSPHPEPCTLSREPGPLHPAPNALRHGSDPCTLHPAPSTLLMEFPLSTIRLGRFNFPISGGGYFRLIPYPFIRKGLGLINEAERKSFVFYVHPWEFDPGQPRFNNSGMLSRFRHYINLKKTESKWNRLLKDFRFLSIAEFMRQGHLN
jgi:polysaccharide deacetylase family protein (PEP-CTERM system associated)